VEVDLKDRADLAVVLLDAMAYVESGRAKGKVVVRVR
jgi:hypothetical protein